MNRAWSTYDGTRMLLRPRRHSVEGVPVIVCHGAGQDQLTTGSVPTLAGHFRLVRQLGTRHPTLISNLGGDQTWANDVARDAFLADVAYLAALGFDVTRILIVAISMGFTVACRIAAEHPELVCGVVGAMPVASQDNLYQENISDARPFIELAHGLEWPEPLPPLVDPLQTAEHLIGIPMRAYTASNDPIAAPEFMTQLATLAGGTVVDLGPLGHSEELLAAVPGDELAAVLSGWSRI